MLRNISGRKVAEDVLTMETPLWRRGKISERSLNTNKVSRYLSHFSHIDVSGKVDCDFEHRLHSPQCYGGLTVNVCQSTDACKEQARRFHKGRVVVVYWNVNHHLEKWISCLNSLRAQYKWISYIPLWTYEGTVNVFFGRLLKTVAFFISINWGILLLATQYRMYWKKIRPQWTSWCP